MINKVIDKLHQGDYYNCSEAVEIAKGKYELVTTWKAAFKKIKRLWLLKKR